MGRAWLPAGVLACLLLALAAGTAAGHQTVHLSNGAVAPRIASTGAQVSFAVTYTDRNGAAPREVAVIVGHARIAMTATSHSFSDGARYGYMGSFAAGRHEVHFTATDAKGVTEVLGAGDIWIRSGEPSPKPNPTPTPHPAPTTDPGAGRTPAPTPAPSGTGSRPKGTQVPAGGDPTQPPAGQPTPPPTCAPEPTPVGGSQGGEATEPPATPVPSAGQGDGSGGGDGSRPGGSGSGGSGGQTGGTQHPGAGATAGAQATPAPGATPGSTPGAEQVIGVVVTNANDAHPNGAGGSPAGAIALPAPARGHGRDIEAYLAFGQHLTWTQTLTVLAPTIATTTTGAAAWAAFIIFGKRRRDGDPPAPEEVLAAAAATGLEVGAAPGLNVADESDLPRWRRPSLQAARKTDPTRCVAEAAHLSFGSTGVQPYANFERRHIRYRLVRLLDSPDELRSAEIGVLDEGDEVQLLERYGAYWRVLCPDGRQGWLHRMTLTQSADEAARGGTDPGGQSEADGGMRTGARDVRQEPAGTGLLDAYIKARADAAVQVQPVVAPEAETGGLLDAYIRARAETLTQLEAGAAQEQEPESLADTYIAARIGAVEPIVSDPRGEEPGCADERYSARRNGDSRTASGASRPGTRSRRPSR